MIRHATFMHMGENSRARGYGDFSTPIYINHWAVLKKCLEEGDDTYIWVVTRKQHPNFVAMLKKYDLEKFCIVKHMKSATYKYDMNGDVSGMDGVEGEEGITNHNYSDDKRKLKLFVMKGAKAK